MSEDKDLFKKVTISGNGEIKTEADDYFCTLDGVRIKYKSDPDYAENIKEYKRLFIRNDECLQIMNALNNSCRMANEALSLIKCKIGNADSELYVLGNFKDMLDDCTKKEDVLNKIEELNMFKETLVDDLENARSHYKDCYEALKLMDFKEEVKDV